MKIDVTKIYHGLITERDDVVKRDLFRDLYQQVYGQSLRSTWQLTSRNSNLRTLERPVIDLSHMAWMLRQMGWSAYYWRDRHGVNAGRDTVSHINYGQAQGLVFGIYCVKLTAWLLSHT